MRRLFLFLLLFNINPIIGEQNLLQRVKNNPNEAIKLCKKLKNFNSQGLRSTDEKVINYVSKKKGLDTLNSEIYSLYAINLYCPEVN